MLKILQARLQQYVNQNFQMHKLGFKEAEESEIKLTTSMEKAKKFQKTIYFCFID